MGRGGGSLDIFSPRASVRRTKPDIAPPPRLGASLRRAEARPQRQRRDMFIASRSKPLSSPSGAAWPGPSERRWSSW